MTPSTPLPQFSKLNPQTFPAQLEVLLNKNQTQVKALLASTPAYTWDNLIKPLEQLSNKLEQFWAPFSHLHSVKGEKPIRESYAQCLPLLSRYESWMNQHEGLYQAICSIELENLSTTKQKIIADLRRDFELSGVHLPAKQKKRFEQIETRLSELQTQFENHIVDTTQAFELHITDESQLEGLPEHAVQTAAKKAKDQNKQGWILGIDPPCYQAVMMNAKNRNLRETLYQAYVTRASLEPPHDTKYDNAPLMQEILSLRHEMASLLNCAHYAELSLKTKMAKDVSEARSFLEQLVKRVRPQAQKELETLQIFAKKSCEIDKLMPWDTGFVSEQLKEANFAFSDESLRPYFTEAQIWKTIGHILQSLYQVDIKVLSGVDTWDKLVQCLALIDAMGNCKGILYVDLFARPYKRGGAWMDSLQTHMKLDKHQTQIPIATLTCNFSAPSKGKEATFLHDELVTLLHELGHCLHHLLTEVESYHAAGIHGVEWDAVELPSQFFEHWAWDASMLTQFTQRPAPHGSLPLGRIQKLLQTQTFLSGLALLRQLEFALFDLHLHALQPAEDEKWIKETLEEVRKLTSLLPVMPYNRFENGFSHIFAGGYAAGYYSYLWAEVLSSDCFSAFEKAGILDEKTGRRFLEEILSRGSSRTARENFEAFMERGLSMDAFLRHRGVV